MDSGSSSSMESLSGWESSPSVEAVECLMKVQRVYVDNNGDTRYQMNDGPVKVSYEADSSTHNDIEIQGPADSDEEPAAESRPRSPESWSDSTDSCSMITPSRLCDRSYERRSPPVESIQDCIGEIMEEERKKAEALINEEAQNIESPKSILKKALPKELKYLFGEASGETPKKGKLDRLLAIGETKNTYNLRSKKQVGMRVTRSGKIINKNE